jgi:hypothetical protein
MAKVGFMGLTWVDSRGKRQSTKFNWNKDAKRLIGAAAAVALQKAGMEVRRITQRQIVGGSTRTGRTLRPKPVWWHVGEKDGYPVVAYVRKVPRPDKVSSWAPKAFLRNDVQSDYDARRNSVVIGPSKFPWLNQLHEFGGTESYYLKRTKYPVKEYGGHKLPRKFQRQVTYNVGKKGRTAKRYEGAYVGVFSNTRGNFFVGTRSLRGRGYMEIGLQASLSKIPAQFRGTISYGNVRKWRG